MSINLERDDCMPPRHSGIGLTPSVHAAMVAVGANILV